MMRIGTAIAVVLGVSLWHGTAEACTSDNECKGDRICVNGTCQDAKPQAATGEPPAARPAPKKEERTAPVQFRPKKEGQVYKVAVAGGEPCVTPCTMHVKPGVQHIVVSGAGAFEADIDVPATGTVVELRSENRALRITGGALAVSGSLAVLAGLGWYIGASRSCDANYGSVSVCSYPGPIALLATGGAAGLAGWIMFLARGESRADMIAPPPVAANKPPAVRFLGVGLDVGPHKKAVPVVSFSF